MTRLGVSAAFIDDDWLHGDIAVENGAIVQVGIPTTSPSTTIAISGFVDLQVNGFAGQDFLTAGPEQLQYSARKMEATGVAAFQPTLITASIHEASPAAQNCIDAFADPSWTGPASIGLHLEGPHISPHRAGAHPKHGATPT